MKKAPDEEVQPAKTAWDWLQLLIVPAMLAGIAVYFSAAQASRDRSHEDRQIGEDRALAEQARQDATLEDYFARVSDLMLTNKLTRSKPGEPVREVARTVTLATLRRLDGRRKGDVVRFLYEAGLLKYQVTRGMFPEHLIDGADLRGADLRNLIADHKPLDLSLTDLRGARFDGALLDGASLGYGKMQGASFRGATLEGVDFTAADLTGAVFDSAEVSDFAGTPTSFDEACVTNTSFVGVDFRPFAGNHKIVFSAVGRGTDFSHARNVDMLDVANSPLFGETILLDVRFKGVQERPSGWSDIARRSRGRHITGDPCPRYYTLGSENPIAP